MLSIFAINMPTRKERLVHSKNQFADKEEYVLKIVSPVKHLKPTYSLGNDTADGVFSKLSNNKMVLYPFISVQHDFGYSDVTKHNNEINGLISKFFEDADRRLQIYKNVYRRYIEKTDTTDEPLFIPTSDFQVKKFHNSEHYMQKLQLRKLNSNK